MRSSDVRRRLVTTGLALALTLPASLAVASTAQAMETRPLERSATAESFRVIGRGDTGQRVRNVQRWVDVRRTGYYGKRTAREVRAFQNRRGFVVTGRVNARTWTALRAQWTKTSKRYHRILAEAREHYGDPYVYGAAGPHAFDCSGFTMYVYRQAAGIGLPHQSGEQYHRTTKISRSEARPGDLVFFHSGSSVYHAAIYAGRNRIIHSPSSGRVVQKDRIWSNSVWFGRMIGR